MNNTVHSINICREDLTDYLLHFTKHAEGFDTLLKILDEKQIKTEHKEFLCFTETPLPMLDGTFDVLCRYEDPVFAPYGIGIRKKELYNLGARPVFYGSKEDKDVLAKTPLNWIFEELRPNDEDYRDYSWLREWRLPQKQLDLSSLTEFIVIVKNDAELDILFYPAPSDVIVDGDYSDGEFHPEYHLVHHRQYRGLSLESIKNKKMSKGVIEYEIFFQDENDTITEFAGI